MSNLEDIISRASEGSFSIVSDFDAFDLKSQFQKLKAHRFKQDTQNRKWLAVWTAMVVTLWLVAVIVLLMFNRTNFFLNDNVLLMLLGTTTFNVLGLSYIVLTGHFPKGKREALKVFSR